MDFGGGTVRTMVVALASIWRLALVCIASVLALSAYAGGGSRGSATDAAAASTLSAYPQAAPGLYTGGQPAPAEWPALAAAGVATVINLRAPEELQGRDEAAEVAAQGMRYLSMPVVGPDDVTDANAARLWQAIHEADGKVLVHCASGNRVGALLALAAYRNGGMDAPAALAFGQSAGLTRLEPLVREHLDCRLASEDAVADADMDATDSETPAIPCVGN